MEKISSLLQGLASLAWPLIVLVVIYRFRDIIRPIIESAKSRKFTVKVAGNELTMEEASEQQRHLIGDLQKQIVDIQNILGIMIGEPAPERKQLGEPENVRSVLWVDDNPKNNAYLVAFLNERGIEVVEALSTAEGISRFTSQKFDRVVSDMGRAEDGHYNTTAGLDLVRQIRAIDPAVPIFIYCSRRAAEKNREAALAAGANGITASASFLLNALQLRDAT